MTGEIEMILYNPAVKQPIGNLLDDRTLRTVQSSIVEGRRSPKLRFGDNWQSIEEVNGVNFGMLMYEGVVQYCAYWVSTNQRYREFRSFMEMRKEIRERRKTWG